VMPESGPELEAEADAVVHVGVAGVNVMINYFVEFQKNSSKMTFFLKTYVIIIFLH
jgi:hypothetical protein